MPEHVRIKVNPISWAETPKSWKLGTKEGELGSWSEFVWFPKGRCILDPKGFITMPIDVYKMKFKGNYKPKILNSQ